MSKETTLKGKLGDLLRLLAALNANDELVHLTMSRDQFAELLRQCQESLDRQALFTAGKQEASQQLRTFLIEAQRLGNVLRLAVKHHYGIRSEKLAQFGIQPFRGRTRKEQEPTPKPPQPAL